MRRCTRFAPWTSRTWRSWTRLTKSCIDGEVSRRRGEATRRGTGASAAAGQRAAMGPDDAAPDDLPPQRLLQDRAQRAAGGGHRRAFSVGYPIRCAAAADAVATGSAQDRAGGRARRGRYVAGGLRAGSRRAARADGPFLRCVRGLLLSDASDLRADDSPPLAAMGLPARGSPSAAVRRLRLKETGQPGNR